MVLVIVVAVVAVILINNNKGNGDNGNNGNNGQSSKEVLNDDFFKSTDNKVVISTSDTNTTSSTDSSVAKKVHQVYTIDGDKITGLKVYSEFGSEEAAKTADAKPEIEEGIKEGKYVDHKVEGNYVIVTLPESMYSSVSAEDIKATAAALEQVIQNGVDQNSQTKSTETQTQSTETTTDESEE